MKDSMEQFADDYISLSLEERYGIIKTLVLIMIL